MNQSATKVLYLRRPENLTFQQPLEEPTAAQATQLILLRVEPGE